MLVAGTYNTHGEGDNSMLEANDLAVLHLGVTVTTRKRDLSKVARIWVHSRHGVGMTLMTQEWPSGAPTPGQVQDLLVRLSEEVSASIVTSCGIQGVLPM